MRELLGDVRDDGDVCRARGLNHAVKGLLHGVVARDPDGIGASRHDCLGCLEDLCGRRHRPLFECETPLLEDGARHVEHFLGVGLCAVMHAADATRARHELLDQIDGLRHGRKGADTRHEGQMIREAGARACGDGIVDVGEDDWSIAHRGTGSGEARSGEGHDQIEAPGIEVLE